MYFNNIFAENYWQLGFHAIIFAYFNSKLFLETLFLETSMLFELIVVYCDSISKYVIQKESKVYKMHKKQFFIQTDYFI